MIKSIEGHGRLDDIKETEVIGHTICRFNYPQFPSEKTMFIPAIDISLAEEEVVRRKNDLKKIRKFLIRQTGYGQGKREDSDL